MFYGVITFKTGNGEASVLNQGRAREEVTLERNPRQIYWCLL